ncbi:MAG: tetratricopeptide repeat protein [Planctomycetes bacterium]|nr:tetratricopeptide repeat protein [Planctomycetota bacterium]
MSPSKVIVKTPDRAKLILQNILTILLLILCAASVIVGLRHRSTAADLLTREAQRRRVAWKMQSLRDDLWRADRLARAGRSPDEIESIKTLADAIATGAYEILSMQPENDEALTLAGRAYELRHDFATAEAQYTQACDAVESVGRDPDGKPAYFSISSMFRGLLRVRLLLRRTLLDPSERAALKDLHEQAMRDLNRAMNRLPDPLQKCLLLAGLQICDDKPRLAVGSCSVAIETDRTEWFALLMRGVARLWLKEDSEARDDFLNATQVYPYAAEPHAYLGAALLRLGKRGPAIEALGESLTRDPNFFEAYYLRGLLFQEEGLYEEAAQHFRVSVQLRPGHSDAARRHADMALEAWTRGGQRDRSLLDLAVESATSLLNAHPEDPSAWILRARLHEARGRIEAAESDAAAAIRAAPDAADAYRVRAELRAGRGAWKEAVQDWSEAWNRAKEAEPKNAYRRARARALARSGEADEALREFDALRAEDPHDLALAIDRLDALARAGHPDRALADSEELLGHPAATSRVHAFRAALFLDRKDYDRAIAEATAAYEADTANVDALLTRARARAARGDREPALQDLQRAAEHAPGRLEEIKKIMSAVRGDE